MSLKFKSIVDFLHVLSDFIIWRNFGKIISDFSRKYSGTRELAEFRKVEKLSNKARKADLDVSFSKSCQTVNVFP